MRRLKNKNWYQGLELLEYIHWTEPQNQVLKHWPTSNKE